MDERMTAGAVGSYAAHSDELAEDGALAFGAESEEDMRILADYLMHEKFALLDIFERRVGGE